MNNWLQGRSVEKKLKETPIGIEDKEQNNYLFRMIRTSIGIYGHQETRSKLEDLRSTYMHDDFAKASLTVLVVSRD